MTGYDSIYRRFFSHPEMVLDLLQKFVGGSWIEELDPDSLTMLPAHYVAEELEHREQDLVWRIRYGDDRDLYLYLLLEFQSSVDRFMALRLLVYLGLLYQDLVKKGELTTDGLLPPVLPLVLYNGEEPWWATTELGELVDPATPDLQAFQPRFRYRVIDEVHLPQDLLQAEDSPVAGMIRVERSRSPDELRTSLRQLLEVLDRPDLKKLAPEVETWLRRVVRPKRFRDLNLKSWEELKEVTTMLEERVKQWEQELHAKGVEVGEAQGRTRGLRTALRKQFQLKFRRDLDEVETASVSRADDATLEDLLARILTAEDPSELFPK